MKKTKRLAALMLAVVMVFALGSTALADGPAGLAGDGTGVGIVSTSNEELVVKKTLIVTNEAGAAVAGLQVAYPDVVFTYNIVGSVRDGAYVKDSQGNQTSVRAGIAGGLTIKGGSMSGDTATGTVQIYNGFVTLNANGQEAVQGNLNLVVHPDLFPSPGVYRYKITDATAASVLQTAGVQRKSDFVDEFFLDVYIKNQAPGADEHELWYKDGHPTSTEDPNDPTIMTTDESEAASPAVPVDVDGTPGQDTVNTDYPNGLEVGGFVLTQEEPVGIDGTTGTGNADTVKESGLDDVPLTTGGTVDDTNPKNDDGSDADKLYDKTDGTTTTDSTETGVVTSGDPAAPVQATDGSADNDPIYRHSTNKLDTTSGELDDDDLAKCDVYKTYNVTLTKAVSGAMAETKTDFQFTTIVNNAGLAYSVSDEAVMPTKVNSADYVSGTSDTGVGIKAGEVCTIYGLNPNAGFKYKETNNTQSNYEVTAADGSGAITLTYAGSTQNGSSETTKKLLNGATATAYFDDFATVMSIFTVSESDRSFTTTANRNNYTSAVTFTNTLTDVSPTGIALRYAPYIFMLAAAAVFVVLSRKERGTENA